MSNKYKQATRYFGIPVPGWKDGIWPELEMLKWQMVENMLMAAMRGNVNAVFEEGDMSIRKERSGKYTVMLSATGSAPSARGAVGGAYFDAPSAITWSDLAPGQAYFLYIKGSTKTFQDAGQITTVSSPRRLLSNSVTLLAKVDLIGDPVLDRTPAGKIHARDLAQHVLDDHNPHGEKLTQDEILIRKRLVFGDDTTLELNVGGKIVCIPGSRVASALSSGKEIQDFDTAGSSGAVLQAKDRIAFVQVCRTNPADRGVGEVVIGYYGLDEKVAAPNQAIVRNSGVEGAKMRALIVYE
jgi:hypothetical protein